MLGHATCLLEPTLLSYPTWPRSLGVILRLLQLRRLPIPDSPSPNPPHLLPKRPSLLWLPKLDHPHPLPRLYPLLLPSLGSLVSHPMPVPRSPVYPQSQAHLPGRLAHPPRVPLARLDPSTRAARLPQHRCGPNTQVLPALAPRTRLLSPKLLVAVLLGVPHHAQLILHPILLHCVPKLLRPRSRWPQQLQPLGPLQPELH